MTISYASAPFLVRDDLREAHERVWCNLAEPGTWWTGAERVAIAAEVRQAANCQLCQDRKDALSAAAVTGTHDTTGTLPKLVVEMIHRIATDPGRLSKQWYDQLLAQGLQDTHYVETLGVLGRTISIDSFCRAIGVAQHPLPAPIAGEPPRRRPPTAKVNVAWVPMIPNGEEVGPDADLYQGRPMPNVVRALSLVPDEVRFSIFVLLPAQYMAPFQVGDPTYDPGRAISRAQMELLAARVSALNQCFY
ncbi:MAG: alkylhydroperoxidase-related (seleno)protein [Candidatus Binatia bacterium]